MSKRTRRFVVVGSLAVAAIAAFAGWWFLLRSDAPPPVSLDEAAAAATSTTGGRSIVGTTGLPDAGVDGPWVVAEGGGSYAGYRVNEELASIGFQEAAGRSEGIDASLTIDRGTVTAVQVTVDTTRLMSDQARRDNAIRDQALETRAFPTATFTLTVPIALPTDAASSVAFSVTATGDLTLHGVTHTVSIDLQAQLVGDTIAVIGNTPILFSDYDIAQPRAMAVLSVEDHGVLELQLLFVRG
ncbi:MAG: YceI family protein [Actinomycetota bacterium]